MATSRQEKTYNEIIEYYNYADKLVRAVEDDKSELAEKQFTIVEDAVEKIEKCADQLSTRYIEYVKGGEPQEMMIVVKSCLSEIMVKVKECRARILKLYDKIN
ncbi:MAG TPA: hypothetical protein VI861_03175 [Rickettsiales bacterium]|nr:hypothetical protein [Rickettsiales bacterium]